MASFAYSRPSNEPLIRHEFPSDDARLLQKATTSLVSMYARENNIKLQPVSCYWLGGCRWFLNPAFF